MGPKKGGNDQKPLENKNKNNTPANPTKQPEPLNISHKTNNENKTEKGKNGVPEQKPKPKPLIKNVIGAGPQTVKWIMEDKNYYKSEGNKITLVKPPADSQGSLAMLMEDGAGSDAGSGEHFWTANFGGTESPESLNNSFGITNSRWLKEGHGLFYSGVRTNLDGSGTDDFGPVINAGDTVGVLCSFAKGHLNLYFYHNGRCLGLTFHVSASLFLPTGIRPCVRLFGVGAWATITKEPNGKIPKEKDRGRAPVERFSIEGKWIFKRLVDSTTGNVIPLNLDDKIFKDAKFGIKQDSDNSEMWSFGFWVTHYVGFDAEKKPNNLWIKTRSIHRLNPKERSIRRWDHSIFADFPITVILHNPEKVFLGNQEMRVTKDGKTAIFERARKSRKHSSLEELL